MLETSLCLLFGTAHPQKDVPWAHHQEGYRSPRQQARQWLRQQRLWEFFQGHPQKEWQSGHRQLPGFEHHLSIPVLPMLQQTGDFSPPQVPQEGHWQKA